MTAPLVPAEIDLRDFEFMPLDVFRLRESDLAAIATGDEFRAAVMLWCACWHQVPASSIPSDDRVLAKLAGYARDLDGWLAVKIEAMRGFVECDDGRFYHPVIAEKAIEAWTKRLAFQARTEAARRAKAEAAKAKENVTSNVTCSVTETGAPPVTASRDERGQGTVDIKEERTNFVGFAHAPAVEPPKRSRKAPASAIGSDAKPTPPQVEFAEQAGISGSLFAGEWDRFVDYHLAKGSRMADWTAAWRTWVRNGKRFAPDARAGPPRATPSNGKRSPMASAITGFLDDLRNARDAHPDNGGTHTAGPADGFRADGAGVVSLGRDEWNDSSRARTPASGAGADGEASSRLWRPPLAGRP